MATTTTTETEESSVKIKDYQEDFSFCSKMILTFDIESQNILVSKLKKCASNKILHSTLPSPKPQNVHFVQIFLLYLE